MIEKILQCCYTNASQEIGGKISSGWQPVAVSSQIPPDAYNTCIAIQNANSAIQGSMVDEQGKILNLFEVVGDGQYVYILRTQYGLQDRLGRANMFSHAYIFPWKDSTVVQNPNVFLTISNKSFKDNEADAENENAPIRMEVLTLASAMNLLGMSSQAYILLIQSIYTQMVEMKNSQPLYVQYDGSDEQMRAILFCIYKGLPYYLRKTFSAANAIVNAASKRNVIFSEYANQQPNHIIAQTGENSVLTQRVMKKLLRYGFVDYATRKHESIDTEEYFSKLEETAALLGDATASSELILKIAHQRLLGECIGELEGEELKVRLSDAIRTKTQGNVTMDQYIAELLELVADQKLELSEENEVNLYQRMEVSGCDELRRAGERYRIHQFSTLSTGAAAEKLGKMSKEIFASYSKKLAEEQVGEKILDYYYSQRCMSREVPSWDCLAWLLKETDYLKGRGQTEQSVQAVAEKMYDTALNQNHKVKEAFESYVDLMKCIISEQEHVEWVKRAKRNYWSHISLSSVSFEAPEIELYKLMKMENIVKSEMVLRYVALPAYLQNGEGQVFLEALHEFYTDFEGYIEGWEQRNSLEMVLEKANAKGSKWFEWAEIVSRLPRGNALKVVLTIREILRKKEWGQLAGAYRELSTHKLEKSVLSVLNELVIDYCAEADAERPPIALDIWLLIGELHCDNPFDIFEMIKPGIREMEPTEVVDSSHLLREDRIVIDAQRYVETKGEEYKAVKRWLSELKTQEKRARAGDKLGSTKKEGNFLDLIFGGRHVEASSKENSRKGRGKREK